MREEEIPEEHPFNHLPAFGSLGVGSLIPVIFVVEGRHPKEFEDNPKEFYDIAAFFASRQLYCGSRKATLETFKKIEDPEILKKYTCHWILENEETLPKIPESDKILLRKELPEGARKILAERGYL
ncbi:MAG TPA: hypothetical protein VJ485_00035 [archaeon]|nr:hypothetical protein [archaeon]